MEPKKYVIASILVGIGIVIGETTCNYNLVCNQAIDSWRMQSMRAKNFAPANRCVNFRIESSV